MFIDFIKLLIEAPEKLTLGIINLTKYVFTVVLMGMLYNGLIGDYDHIKVEEWPRWMELLIHGKILIYVFLYLVSFAFLFTIGPAVSALPLILLGKIKPRPVRSPKDMGSAVLKMLDFLGLICWDRKNDRLRAGKYTDDLYALLDGFDKSGGGGEVDEDASEGLRIRPGKEPVEPGFDGALINDIWHFYFLFFVYYFVSWKYYPHTLGITAIVVIGFVGIPWVQWFSKLMFDWLTRHAEKVKGYVKGVQLQAIIETGLRDQGWVVEEKSDESGRGFEMRVTYRGMEYSFFLVYVDGEIDADLLGSFIEKIIGQERKVILFTNGRLTEAAAQKARECAERLIILPFEREEDLEKLVRTSFPSEKLFRMIL